MRMVSTVVTAVVIVIGFAVISPMFFRPGEAGAGQRALLSFNISEPDVASEWAADLAFILDAHDVGAVVFISGEVAEQYPETVAQFNENIDVGSQTYNYQDITKIDDYSLKLEEVAEGKDAVDSAGNLGSKVFRAPFGATDQDIYSLLSRSGILADFSYTDHYNIYQDGQFVRYEAAVYAGKDYPPDFFSGLVIDKPLIITFDDTCPVFLIDSFLSGFNEGNLRFVNASELVGFALTDR